MPSLMIFAMLLLMGTLLMSSAGFASDRDETAGIRSAVLNPHQLDQHILPNAILHVGPHKTGTSTLQKALQHLVPALESVNVYTFGVQSRTKGMLEVVKALEQNLMTPAMADFLQFMKSSAQMRRNVIVSCERFDRDQNMTRLLEIFEGFNVIVVMAHRDFHAIVASHHNQKFRRNKQGWQTLEQYYEFNARDPNNAYVRKKLVTSNLAERYGASFGRENVRILDLHGLSLSHSNAVECFFCRIVPELYSHMKNRSNNEASLRGSMNSYTSDDTVCMSAKKWVAEQHVLNPSKDVFLREGLVLAQDQHHWPFLNSQCAETILNAGHYSPRSFHSNEKLRFSEEDLRLKEENEVKLPKRCLNSSQLNYLNGMSFAYDILLRLDWTSHNNILYDENIYRQKHYLTHPFSRFVNVELDDPNIPQPPLPGAFQSPHKSSGDNTFCMLDADKFFGNSYWETWIQGLEKKYCPNTDTPSN